MTALSKDRAVRAVGMHGNTSPSQAGEAPSPARRGCWGALTKSFRNSKLHIRATMLLKTKGNLLKATMLLKAIGFN